MRVIRNFFIDTWRLMAGRPLLGEMAEFKPQVIYNEQMRLTEMILEDTSIVWCPWGPFNGHAVDCGYSPDGRLVGIQIWDDVRSRPVRFPSEQAREVDVSDGEVDHKNFPRA